MLLDRRRSGILLHPTSLPSPHGIGDLGPAARQFIDFLADARQSIWQVLPLGPTGFGNSPYASPSAFAGNPLLISPDALLGDGLVTEDDLTALRALPTEYVDFASLVPLKQMLLETAYHRGRERHRLAIDAFRAQHADWVDDFALFSALKDHHQAVWTDWEPALRHREPDALAHARAEHAERVDFHVFCQFLFAEQWA